MKILITSIVDIKSSQHNRPHQFIKYLSREHDITVLCINDWWKAGQGDLKAYSSDFDDTFKGVNIIHLTEKKMSPIFQELFSSKRVREIIEDDFDVHLNYSTLRSGYVAAKEITTVYDIADDLGAMIRSSPQIPRFLRPFGGFLGDILIKRNIDISKIITVTTENLIESYRIPKGKSRVISNGVDIDLFHDYGCTKKEELGLDGFILGYVGVLREWVDFEPVFKALKRLNKEIKMVIIGREGRFKENINMAKKYGLEDRVIFTGMIPYPKVPEYISAMDICIIPFRQGAISENAVPLKLFEYMACNKPVICTELSGVKRIAKNRVLYADNDEDYYMHIHKLYNDYDMMSHLGESGRKFVESNYDWSKIVAQLETILVEALI